MTVEKPNDLPQADQSGRAAGPSQVAQSSAAEKPKSKIPLESTEFFGPRGWTAVLLPYLVMLIGLQLASYFENARAHTYIKQVADESAFVMGQVTQAMAQQSPATLDKLEGDFAWKQFIEDLKLISMGEHFVFDDVEGRAALALSAFDSIPMGGKERLKEPVDFMFKLLALDEDGKTRAIIADSFERQQKMLAAAGQPLRDTGGRWFPANRSWYPTTYSFTVLLTTVITIAGFGKLLRVPFRITPLAIGVGVVGIFVWLGMWWLGTHLPWLSQYFRGRDAFNPLEELKSDPTWMYTFLSIRFFGLVLLVPIVEEFFLRGFLTRYIDHPDWDRVPIDLLTKLSLSGIVIYAVVSHPTEALAAVAWFSLVTWLFIKTKNIWDCVIAHAVTNLLLGIFVLTTGTWVLW